MCRCELEANCTSRRTCSDLLECAEKISTITLLRWMARLISPAKVRPGWTSRGAIQQRMVALSSAAHAASATGLSSDECEIKTSCAIQGVSIRFYLSRAEQATELRHFGIVRLHHRRLCDV